MIRRIVALSAFFLVFAGVSVAQTPVTEDVEEVTTDSPNANVGTEAAADRSAEGAPAEAAKTEAVAADQTAKTYFDGVSMFANSKVKFQLSTSDNFFADKIFYKQNDGADTEYTAPFAIDQEGKYTVRYHGVDKVGNKEDEKVFHVVIDNTAPEITVMAKKPVVIVNGNYYTAKTNALTIVGADNLSGFYMAQYSLNGTDFSEYTTTFSFNVEGDTNFQIKAEDNVANKTNQFKMLLPLADGGEKIESVTGLKLFVDAVAPTVMIKSDKELMDKGGKKVASRDYLFSVSAEDKESGIKKVLYRVDGKGEFMAYEKEIQFTSNGDHFIEAKSVDMVGNESQIAIMPVYIDIVPPKSEIKAVTE